MHITKTKQVKALSIKLIGFICLSSFLNAQAQQVLEEIKNPNEISYLKSKDELKDYILDTGDSLSIRFKNRPRQLPKEGIEEKISKSNISYLEPRNNLENYILDTGDSVSLDFNDVEEFSGIYNINEEGEVNLPRIDNTYIKGLTISELKILLEKRYEEYLVSPDIDVEISNFKFIPNGVFTINEEGDIILPEITTDPDETTRKTFVRGLTKNQLENLLEKRYKKYFINPKVFIQISTFKPIRVLIRGEVRTPGLFKFPAYSTSNVSTILEPIEVKKINYDSSISSKSRINSLSMRSFEKEDEIDSNQLSNKINSQNLYSNKTINTSSTNIPTNKIKRNNEYLTTLSNAIQGAGGLTSYSDVSKIEIIRDIPIEKGGGKKRALINFLSYINEADNSSDIRLFDGDYIFIHSLKEKDPSIIPNSILSGLSPRFISVQVSGQIENPGNVQIPIEGSLSDVMNLTGPRKPLSGKVFLIRYQQDGSLLRKNIKYSSTAKPGSPNNPFLVSNDLITVKNSILGRASGTIRAITEPFVGIYAAKEVVESISGN